jgi:hypothetical protein
VAGSYWAHSLNGLAIDQSIELVEGTGTPPTVAGHWFNTHTAAPISGPTAQPGYVVGPNTRVYSYLRAPHNNDQIIWRLVITDQPTTPEPTSPPCQYGSQLKSGQPFNTYVTLELLTSVLTAVAAPEFIPLFVPLIGFNLVVGDLCNRQPPPMPLLHADPLANSLADLQQGLGAVSWPFFCECVPGTPAPIPYPPPSLVAPPGIPTFPIFPCDPADLCSSVSAIRQAVFALASGLAETKELVTLLQRYSLPFAYAPGAVHIGLTGEGEFAVSRLLGFQVQVDQRPDDGLVLPGKPPYFWDMGWMAVSDSSGMLEEKRITRQQQTWLPTACQDALTFSYSLNPGVTVSVRELAPER